MPYITSAQNEILQAGQYIHEGISRNRSFSFLYYAFERFTLLPNTAYQLFNLPQISGKTPLFLGPLYSSSLLSPAPAAGFLS